jgi:hypothetical protein
MKSYVIAFEIDGVLADKDGNAIPSGVVLYNMLVTQAQIMGHALQHMEKEGVDTEGGEIPFVDVITYRPDSRMDETAQWFHDNGLLPPRSIHARMDLDIRPAHEVKMAMYDGIYQGKEEMLGVFEADADTVKAFRDRGVACYLAGEYNEKPQSLIHLN